MTPSTLKAIRLTHLYFGVFIAPAVLFFSITGFIQTFSLHETTRGRSYVPPAILVHLSQLHKKATLVIPERKPPATPPRPVAATPAPAPPPAAALPPAAKVPEPPPVSHLPMKLFFAVVAIGLVTSTFSGLIMAWKYTRNKPLVAGIFVTGIIIPLLLLRF